ncbi:helicase-related protein [Hymenobacter qilianensis]|uniref:DEAD/DEAH box helicase n=2 Tax=Hymenobacter qilianensis TaxID=1385715 RepID=A0A7H0GT45_9BACT|nr:DEAD/DEAH box helicase [Hymenobacter qilianensis]
MQFAPGSLVNARGRDWVVMPSLDPDLLLLQPLGGNEAETTGIYLPLRSPGDEVRTHAFPGPKSEDLGAFPSARLLYNAARLSFRSGAGPFRSLARLSFRPRSYQLVPLIMALRQAPDAVRLLVADDVGVGKTIEAILIIKELLERREIRRFAVVCLPHLCEQWQQELRDKAGLEAVIIRSNTQARLDRAVDGDTPVYEHYPFQVISIDYIKSDQRRSVFLHHAPELVIVDEAHTAARPAGALVSQQQRYHLVHDLSKRAKQHLVLLTATPHSGKPEEFRSLLGLLDKKFETLDLPNASKADQQHLARLFVQRRRIDVEKWLGEDTPFPKREADEESYALSPEYQRIYADVLQLAQELAQRGSELHGGQQKFHYWTALALLRGVMSSPAAGAEMLRNRQRNLPNDDGELATEAEGPNPVLDQDYEFDGDFTPSQVISRAAINDSQRAKLSRLIGQLESLQNISTDHKAAQAIKLLYSWLKLGYQPVIFCRYIATATYLGGLLKQELTRVGSQAVRVEVVTSEDPDEVRRERIDQMADSPLRVLVATDCLSEGINLQHSFTAVLHYDLPWNPNRLEQREGRVDRFGQTAPTVKAYLLYGRDNDIDSVVLGVLLRKVREIRKDTGITVPFPEDSESVLDAVLAAVLLNPKAASRAALATQLTIDFGEAPEVTKQKALVRSAYDKAIDAEKLSRSLYAQHAIKAHEVAADLRQADEAIGDPAAVEAFVTEALPALLGVQITRNPSRPTDGGAHTYTLYTANLPKNLRGALPGAEATVPPTQLLVCFASPTPDGFHYLGRNHLFVEQLCQQLLASALHHRKDAPARAAVVRTSAVLVRTTLLLFRVRNVIEERSSRQQLVAEEMLIWGYKGDPTSGEAFNILTPEEAHILLLTAVPEADLPRPVAAQLLQDAADELPALVPSFNEVATTRAAKLVEAHERFRQVVQGGRYQVVTPVLPMDVLGQYVLLPPKT